MNPQFSIAIPVYNRRDFLRQAIISALMQTVRDSEIIVSDDCSTEDLETVVASFDDPRIKYHRSPSRLGAAQNHQVSVNLCRGEYVVNLHSDDLLLPNYLEMAGSELERSSMVGAVYSSVAYLSESEITGYQEVPKVRVADVRVYAESPWLETFHNVAPTSCMFRRSTFLKIGGYRASLRFAYDWDLFMRFMTIGGGVVFSREILSIYRRHEEQAARMSGEHAFYDVLDLWRLREYSHWSASEISALMLTVLRERLSYRQWAEIIGHINDRGLMTRLLLGVPGALRRRLGRARRSREEAENYEPPAHVDTALSAAKVIVQEVVTGYREPTPKKGCV